ncbi:MAG: hypothetical protein ACJAVA_002515, partial [Flavobacteriaceae bacterium]
YFSYTNSLGTIPHFVEKTNNNFKLTFKKRKKNILKLETLTADFQNITKTLVRIENDIYCWN